MTSLIEQLRKPRFHILGKNPAIFDVSATVASGYIIGKYFGYNPVMTGAIALPIGHAVHYFMDVKTQFNEPSNEPSNETSNNPKIILNRDLYRGGGLTAQVY